MKTITKQIATSSSHRDEFWHKTVKNSDGMPARCRVNGQCKVWKTRPLEFRLPVKYGMYECFYIDQDNCQDWYLPE